MSIPVICALLRRGLSYSVFVLDPAKDCTDPNNNPVPPCSFSWHAFGLMQPSLPPIIWPLFNIKTRKALKQTGQGLSVEMLPLAALEGNENTEICCCSQNLSLCKMHHLQNLCGGKVVSFVSLSYKWVPETHQVFLLGKRGSFFCFFFLYTVF